MLFPLQQLPYQSTLMGKKYKTKPAFRLTELEQQATLKSEEETY